MSSETLVSGDRVIQEGGRPREGEERALTVTQTLLGKRSDHPRQSHRIVQDLHILWLRKTSL